MKKATWVVLTAVTAVLLVGSQTSQAAAAALYVPPYEGSDVEKSCDNDLSSSCSAFADHVTGLVRVAATVAAPNTDLNPGSAASSATARIHATHTEAQEPQQGLTFTIRFHVNSAEARIEQTASQSAAADASLWADAFAPSGCGGTSTRKIAEGQYGPTSVSNQDVDISFLVSCQDPGPYRIRAGASASARLWGKWEGVCVPVITAPVCAGTDAGLATARSAVDANVSSITVTSNGKSPRSRAAVSTSEVVISAPAEPTDSTPAVECNKYLTSVALKEGGAAEQHVASWLCWRGSLARRPTVQVLLSGNTYGHVYWDIPYQPETYSYVRAMTAAGYAVLNIDRIGIGESSHPLSPEVTLSSNVYVVHQLIDNLRKGTLDPEMTVPPLTKVLLVGHSYGSLMSIVESVDYGDVDGIVFMSLLHNPGPGISLAGSALTPAQTEPRLADRPPGYFTTRSGSRNVFYYEPGADAAAIATDEQTKETQTVEELAESEDGLAKSSSVHVPVLIAVGEFDRHWCPQLDAELMCVKGAMNDAIATEMGYWQDGYVETYSVPDAGHSLNFHRSAPLLYQQIQSWANDHGLGSASSRL